MAAIAFRLDVPARFLDVHGQRAGFVLLASFLLSFLFIRTSARMNRSPRFAWWPGSVTTGGGLHLHHLVWGIVLVLLTGFVNFATQPASPWSEFLAAGFGIGAGFTLDEFALWIYLRDVYWTEEGRSSFDAVVVATLIGGLIVLGFAPFDLANDSTSVGSWAVIVIADVLLGALAILKGKPLIGLIGLFIPVVSLAGRFGWARRGHGGVGGSTPRTAASSHARRSAGDGWRRGVVGSPMRSRARRARPRWRQRSTPRSPHLRGPHRPPTSSPAVRTLPRLASQPV